MYLKCQKFYLQHGASPGGSLVQFSSTSTTLMGVATIPGGVWQSTGPSGTV